VCVWDAESYWTRVSHAVETYHHKHVICSNELPCSARHQWKWNLRQLDRGRQTTSTQRRQWGQGLRGGGHQENIVGLMFKQEIPIWEEPRRHASRQRITTPQSSHWLQRDAPHLPIKLPFRLRRSPTFHLIHPPLDRPRSPPKMHLDLISRFSTIHPADRLTDRQTDRQTFRC